MNSDDVVKKITELAKESGEAAKQLFGIGCEKAKELTGTMKLNLDISTKYKLLDKLYAELGKLYFQNRETGENDKIAAICKKIESVLAQIAELEEEYETMKKRSRSEAEKTSEAETVIVCSSCGAKNSTDNEFCVGCGILLN